VSTPGDGRKLLLLRKLLGYSQTTMSKQLKISSSQISAIERCEKPFAIGLKDLCVTKFGVRRAWIFDNIGEPFSEHKSPPPKVNMSTKGLILAAGLGPIAPTVAAAIALGIGTNEILNKIAKAYGAQNIKELAQKHFGVTPAAVSGWIKRNKIPEEYLVKAVVGGKITLEELLSNDEYVMIKKMDLMDVMKKVNEKADVRNMKPSDLVEIFDEQLENYQKPLR